MYVHSQETFRIKTLSKNDDDEMKYTISFSLISVFVIIFVMMPFDNKSISAFVSHEMKSTTKKNVI